VIKLVTGNGNPRMIWQRMSKTDVSLVAGLLQTYVVTGCDYFHFPGQVSATPRLPRSKRAADDHPSQAGPVVQFRMLLRARAASSQVTEI
jgi:hypothetical protein